MSQSKRNMKVLRARTLGLQGFVDSGKATGTLLTHLAELINRRAAGEPMDPKSAELADGLIEALRPFAAAVGKIVNILRIGGGQQ